jgi:uncharacterized membrane-anchored protein YhcB (DUF1043 family)
VATLTKPNQTEKDKLKMKTTLTQKIDNYLETTHGAMTLLTTIGVFIGSLFALGISHDYNLATATAFGLVSFLVVVGVMLGGLGAYIVAEKNGERNTADTARHLHKYYKNELGKVQAELASAYTAHAETLDGLADYSALAHAVTVAQDTVTALTAQRDGYLAICNTNELLVSALRETHARNERELVADLARYRQRLADYGCDLVEHDHADKYADTLHTLTNAVYHFGWALIEDYDLFESAKFRLLALHGETTTDTAKAQAFREYVLDIYADDDTPSVYLGEHFTPSA